VHFKLASLFENGTFGDPDLHSAIFHVECAAKLGDAAANVNLYSVCILCIHIYIYIYMYIYI